MRRFPKVVGVFRMNESMSTSLPTGTGFEKRKERGGTDSPIQRIKIVRRIDPILLRLK